MNRCGYYSCKNGKPTCSNQTKRVSYFNASTCNFCKYAFGGIYPSQFPSYDLTKEKFEVIDKNGTVLN